MLVGVIGFVKMVFSHSPQIKVLGFTINYKKDYVQLIIGQMQ